MAKESAKKRTAKAGDRRPKLPYPRNYSLRVFYGPGINPAIDQALFKIVGSSYSSYPMDQHIAPEFVTEREAARPYSSGCFPDRRKSRDLHWAFKTKRSAIAAANRIINRVTVPGGNLLLPRKRSGPIVTLGLLAQKIRRVEVWEEAPRRVLNVGFQARGKEKP